MLRALMEAQADCDIHVVSKLPPEFLLNRLPSAPASIRADALDVGMVQIDSVRVDVPATLLRVLDLIERRDEWVAREQEWLGSIHAGVVVSDIASFPLEAASHMGIPGLAVGNFCWDWIYSSFVEQDVRWQEAIDLFRSGYGMCDLLMRLPFADAMTAFPNQIDLPLLSRPGVEMRSRMAEDLGCDPSKPWVLLSFTTLDWDASALDQVRGLTEWEFFTVQPLAWQGANLHAVDREHFSFGTVLASCDVVVTKPGYGILSECVVNEKPIIYTERTDFIEYPILEGAIKKHLKHIHIPSEMLYAGDLESSLRAIGTAPAPKQALSAGGERMAAETILRYLGE